MIQRFFITGTNTAVGKTHVTALLARALVTRGTPTVALKPVETGVVNGKAKDAVQLSDACGHPELANFEGFYRAEPPIAPAAAALATGHNVPPTSSLVASVQAAEANLSAAVSLVEGCGGLLVPLDTKRTVADFALALNSPLIVVSSNELGTVGSTLATLEVATRRGLDVIAVVLVQTTPPDDGPAQDARMFHPSQRSAALIKQHAPQSVTIVELPYGAELSHAVQLLDIIQ